MAKEGISFTEALSRAQKAGFAEADASFDIDGIDTANKLSILASIAWSGWVKMENIPISGIRDVSREDMDFARKNGFVIKLIGEAHDGKGRPQLSVGPALIPQTHAFANVDKEYNAVLIHGDASGDVMFYGKGAGQLPAASAVVSDIIYLARQIANETAGKLPYISYEKSKKIRIMPAKKRVGSYYLRFSCIDKPGVLSRISGVLGKYKVSIASVYQEESPNQRNKTSVPVIILTHPAVEENILKAVEVINRLPIIKKKTVNFKVEN